MSREEDLWWGTGPGRSPEQRADRRGAVRYPVPASRQEATLKIASSSWPVRVVEISTGGFDVLAAGSLETVHVGLVGELQTADGNFGVRVANVSEVGSHGATAPPVRTVLRLGLYHLGEPTLLDKGQFAALHPWKSKARWRWRFSQPTATLVLTAVVLTIVLLPMILVSDARMPDRAMLRDLLSWGRHAVGLDGKVRRQQPGADAAGVAPSPGGELAKSRTVRHLAQELPGSEPFAAPEVAGALGLTFQQQVQLDELLRATRWAVQELDQRWQSDSRQAHAQRRARILDAARQEALTILTPSQRAAWAKLTE